ncbi:hypothetical protein [Thiorhodococcus minor]|uniref:Uncharacterized protein n=1 Tax=Thiorhodococcus minor TaxID=57489 RepID=A0A6M0JVQ2_9GAMM|nr:hypothetical protein [Thiorhodococcus minor]NEV61612.1 hypothetical protein [Thiorhodococcus minor]
MTDRSLHRLQSALYAKSTSAGRVRSSVRRPERGRLPPLLAVVAWILLAAGLAMADEAVVATRAGWIDSFEGPAKGYAVIRVGQELPVRYLMPLEQGDLVEVRAADGRIRIRLGEGKEISLSHARSRFTVPAPAAPPTTWGNLVRWAGDWLTALHSDAAPTRTITAASRGETDIPLSSGLLSSERVGWPAGQRPITLAWNGGQPPFQVTVVATADPAKEPVLKEIGIRQRIHRTAPVMLEPAEYLLVIADAAGYAWRTLVIAGAEEAVPKPPAGSIPDDLPPEVRTTVEAAWLACQDGGQPWRLTAYQQVADLGDYPPAALLRRALVEDAKLPASAKAGDLTSP